MSPNQNEIQSDELKDNQSEDEVNLKKYVIGYGTFIPNKTFLKSTDVRVIIVRHYRRIWTRETIFPFVLEDSSFPGFHALMFSVSQSRLAKMDIYEGVDTGLFLRKEILVEDLQGTKFQAYIYVPSSNTIEEYQLTMQSDPEDEWQKEIAKNAQIVETFPELIQKVSKLE